MTHIEQCSSYASSPRSATSLRHLYNVWRSCRALAALDDAALKDVGLTRHDATREAARPFWDAPNTWRM
jgi:uncharacterized protein YjiS (DUF1127 family)